MNKNVTFKGWYTGQDGAGTKVTRNTYWNDTYGTTLYADWKDLYVITYDANGGFFGRGTSKTPTYITHKTENSKYTKPGSTPNKDGYTLEGWYDAPTGGNKIPLGDPNYLINQDTILYAHWVPVTFKVEVPTVGDTTWTQKATATSGSLTGYKITYYISEIGANDEDADTQTSQSVSGKQEGKKYYVWASAKKNDKILYSNNYLELITSHPSHYGTQTTGGKCYTSSPVYQCTNITNFYYIAGNNNCYIDGIKNRTTGKTPRWCPICGYKWSDGDRYRFTYGRKFYYKCSINCYMQ